jgi:hypothetical protein
MVGAQGYTSIGARVSWGWLWLAEVHGWHALESCGCSGWWSREELDCCSAQAPS